MSDQARERRLADALSATENERDGAERYQRKQRRARRGRARVTPRSPSFLERVARLLNPR
jgi:hypothetical protein